jgi:hypothetical protein
MVQFQKNCITKTRLRFQQNGGEAPQLRLTLGLVCHDPRQGGHPVRARGASWRLRAAHVLRAAPRRCPQVREGRR